MNKTYDDIEKMLCRELENIARKGELTSSNLDVIGKITDAVKDISTIEAMESAGYSNDYSGQNMYDDGYSRNSYRGSYDGGSYDGGSYGRGRYAQRDSQGRYSSDYSGNNYSNHGEDTIQRLHTMMQNAPEQEKQVYQRIINQMQQNNGR